MRFNVAFLILAAGLTFVAAQDKQSTSGQAPSSGQPTEANGAAASAGGAGDVGALIQSLPKCFIECATKASSSATVGCTGLTDVGCLCQKPAFLNATMVCITSSGDNDCGSLAQNRTALQQGQTVFAGVCKAAAGAGAAGGASDGAASGGAGGSETMAGNGTSSGGGAAAATTGGASGTSSTTSAPAGHNGAVIQHVATGSIVLTALLAGAATLL